MSYEKRVILEDIPFDVIDELISEFADSENTMSKFIKNKKKEDINKLFTKNFVKKKLYNALEVIPLDKVQDIILKPTTIYKHHFRATKTPANFTTMYNKLVIPKLQELLDEWIKENITKVIQEKTSQYPLNEPQLANIITSMLYPKSHFSIGKPRKSPRKSPRKPPRKSPRKSARKARKSPRKSARKPRKSARKPRKSPRK